jgi:hypothetical protein
MIETFAFGASLLVGIYLFTFRSREELLICCCAAAAAFYNSSFKLALGDNNIAIMDVLFVMFVFACLFGRRSESRANPRERTTVLFTIALLITYCVLSVRGAMAYEIEVSDSFRDARTVALLWLPLVLSYFSTISESQWSLFADRFFICVGLASAFGAVTFLVRSGSALGTMPRDPAIPYFILPLYTFYSAHRYFSGDHRAHSSLSLFSIGVGTVGTLLSFSRAVYIEFIVLLLLVMAVAILAKFGRRGTASSHRILLGALAAGGALLIVAFTMVTGSGSELFETSLSRFASIAESAADVSVNTRIAEVEQNHEDFLEEVFFGHGAGFRTISMGPEGFERSIFCHSTPYYFLVKYGVFGALMTLALLVRIVWVAFGGVSGSTDYMSRTAFLALGLPISLLTESASGGLNYPPKNLIFGSMLAIAVTSSRRAKGQQPGHGKIILDRSARTPLAVLPTR